MSQRDWDQLTATERAIMTNAFEIDILPGVWADLERPGQVPAWDADQRAPVLA